MGKQHNDNDNSEPNPNLLKKIIIVHETIT